MKKEDIHAKFFWALKDEELFDILKTDKSGLARKEAINRLKSIGPNRITREYKFSKLKIFLKQFKSPLIFILIGAGILTLVLEKWVDSFVIFLAIGVNVVLGFYQENRAEEALERLRSYLKDRVRVTRGGKDMEIDSEELVPGDLIHLSYGVRVPADARVIYSKDFSVDESILTGESLPVTKSTEPISEGASLPERKNMVFGGTLSVEGYATAVVTATGQDTEIGKIAEFVAITKRTKTPLQTAVSKLAWIISAVILVLVIGIFALGMARGEPFFEMFLVSAAVAVGAIPEALPVALTVVLAVGVERLAKRKGIMRSLAAAETLGSTTLIITDKTGTLTEANMELVDIVDAKFLKEGERKDKRKLQKLSHKESEILRMAVLNTDVLVENPEDDYKDWKMVGRALETHIIKSAEKFGLDPLRHKREIAHNVVIPFNSRNKFSVSLAHVGGKDVFIILGAPDILLERTDINKDDYVASMERIGELSNEGKRLLGVGVLPVTNKGKAPTITPEDIKKITFMGVLAFYDPVRRRVPKAIKDIEASGARVVMATGDLKGTAISVARELGWEISDDQVLTGDELRAISDDELKENLSHIRIFARVTPEDKLRIGKLYQELGEIVGMTGDGVNDAPLLKAVDIGIAVGSGSDVAKDVADLVLLDDNFETITAAIEEGRRILNNIRKSFIYLMSNSLDGVVLVGGALLMGLSLPLSALQIIWVNFFTGSLPALSFAFDDFIDKDKTMAKSSKNILDNEVKVLTLGIGILTSILLVVLYWFLVRIEIEPVLAKTFLFACFSSYVLFVAFSFRSLKKPIFSYNIFSNRFLTISVLLGLSLIAGTIYIPFVSDVFGMVALPPVWLLWLAVWVLINVTLVEGVKWVYRNH